MRIPVFRSDRAGREERAGGRAGVWLSQPKFAVSRLTSVREFRSDRAAHQAIGPDWGAHR